MLSAITVTEDSGTWIASLTVNHQYVEGTGDSFSDALRDLIDNYESEVVEGSC